MSHIQCFKSFFDSINRNLQVGNMFSLIIITFLCLASFTNGFPITDCGSKVGNYSHVLISGCDNSKSACILHKGTNATVEIDFTINEDASDLQAVVHGTVLIVPIPFHLPHPDACSDPDSGIKCPLTKGGNFHYKATLPVQSKYPSVSVKIKWELQDQNGNDVVCIMLPAKIR